MAAYEITRCAELNELCERTRDMVRYKNFSGCIDMLREAMARYPGAPQPIICWGLCWRRTETIWMP